MYDALCTGDHTRENAAMHPAKECTPCTSREATRAMLSRLLDAHDAATRVAALGDDGTNDLIVSDVIRTGKLQAWFLAEHLVDTPLVRV
jgi:starvation-inducible DNA-binding protein